jgi:hypothetical protein
MIVARKGCVLACQGLPAGVANNQQGEHTPLLWILKRFAGGHEADLSILTAACW